MRYALLIRNDESAVISPQERSRRAGARARRRPAWGLIRGGNGAAGTVWGTLAVLAWLARMVIRQPRVPRARASAGRGDRSAAGPPG